MSDKWRVTKLPRTRKSEPESVYVRAESEQQAIQIGRALLGRGMLVAAEYRPHLDPAFVGYVRQVKGGGA
jgi:hypothetical protein